MKLQEINVNSQDFRSKAGFQSKIAPSLAPLLHSFKLLKSMESQSHWKKIKIIAVLDNLLAAFWPKAAIN